MTYALHSCAAAGPCHKLTGYSRLCVVLVHSLAACEVLDCGKTCDAKALSQAAVLIGIDLQVTCRLVRCTTAAAMESCCLVKRRACQLDC